MLDGGDGSGRMVSQQSMRRAIGNESGMIDPLSPANNSMSYSMTRGTTAPFNGGLLDQTVGSGTATMI